MTDFISVRIHDLSTGETTDREMTSDELEQFEADRALELSRQKAIIAAAEARAALLDRLGITADEAALLLG